MAIKTADVARLITPVRRTQEKGGVMHQIEHGVSPKLTPEQQRQGFAALEAARKLQAELLAERGGELFPPSWELINELRDERSRQLE